MSTIAAMDRAQSGLIDARLDAIERNLMNCGISRLERAEIVESVAEQVFEMLDSQGGATTREQVIDVLRTLDPPEAYCGSQLFDATGRYPSVARSAAAESAGNPGINTGQRRHSGLAITAFVLGLLAIPCTVVLPLGLFLSLTASIFAVVAITKVSASRGQLRGYWMAVIGYVAFLLQMLFAWALMLM